MPTDTLQSTRQRVGWVWDGLYLNIGSGTYFVTDVGWIESQTMRESDTFEGKCFYSMEVYSPISGKFEVYATSSWLALGWRIFKVRCYHLYKHFRWVD